MPNERDDTVVQIVGNVGRDPEVRTNPNGDEWVNFSVAVTRSYAKKLTRWVRVGTKNPGLVEFVRRAVKVGRPVAVEGFMHVEQYNGKDQYNMTATRIGTVDFGVGTPRVARSENEVDKEFAF